MNAGVQVRPPSVETLKDGIAESCEPTATTVSPEAATLLNAGALTRLPDTLFLDTPLAVVAAALALLACARIRNAAAPPTAAARASGTTTPTTSRRGRLHMPVTSMAASTLSARATHVRFAPVCPGSPAFICLHIVVAQSLSVKVRKPLLKC